MVRANTGTNHSVNLPAPTARRALDGVAYAGMFVFGIVMALLGACMPVLAQRLSLDLGDVGTLFLATNAAMLAASLVVGPAMDRVGMKGPLAVGAALVGAALVAIGQVSRIDALYPAVACLGFGGGILNAGTNTLVADLHEDAATKASALNLLGVFFGFGALFLPFAIGALLASVGLAGVLAAGAILCLATAAATVALRFPPAKQVSGWPLADTRRFLAQPLVLAFAFLLFFESGNEFVIGGYFSTFLARELGQPVQQASYLLGAYWAALMVSRAMLSRLVLRVGARSVVLGGALVAALGVLGIAAAPSTGIALGAVVVTGLALAGVFPSVLGLAGGTFREHSGTVFGILFTVALSGGMTMPWVAGHLAQAAGLRAVFLLVAVNFVAIAVLARMTRST